MNTADLPAILNPDTLWDVDAVARYLSASKSWVYKAAERGELPCIRIGAMLRFAPNAVRAWLKGVRPELCSHGERLPERRDVLRAVEGRGWPLAQAGYVVLHEARCA